MEKLTDVIVRTLDVPFAFFRHSIGSLLAFELARRIREPWVTASDYFVSAHRAPHLPGPRTQLRDPPDDLLIDEVSSFDGTRFVVFEEPELGSLVLSTMRGEFVLHENHRYGPGDRLDCPISAYGGLSDLSVDPDEPKAWREQTSIQFRLSLLPGVHFLVRAEARMLVHTMLHDLSSSG